MNKLSLALLSLIFLAACAESNSGPKDLATIDGQEDAAIVGGHVARSMDFGEKSVVSIRRFTNDEMFCTGTLISPRLVLTAGHCFKMSGLTADDIVIGFAAAPKERFSVHEIHVNQDWNVSDQAHAFHNDIHITADIALISLEADAPAATVIAQLPPAALPIDEKVTVRIYGYGRTSATGKFDEILRHVNKNAVVEASAPDILMDDERNGHGTCNGDSGGPAFLLYQQTSKLPMIVGLVSNTLSVPSFFGHELGDPCKQRNGLTQIGTYLEWIKSNSTEMMDNLKADDAEDEDSDAAPTPTLPLTPTLTPTPAPTVAPTPTTSTSPSEAQGLVQKGRFE